MAWTKIGNLKGPTGGTGSAATVSIGTTTTGAAGTNASVTNSGTSSAATLNFTIPKGDTGTAGTNATTLVGTVTLSETSLITLAIGVRRPGPYALAGTVTTGNYIAIPISAPPAGYSIQDCYCSTNGQITVGVIVPVLSIAGSYSIPVKVYRIN